MRLTIDPGRYDDVTERLIHELKAVGVLLIVVEGEHGNGFSVSTLEPDLLPVLPALLRDVARGIEAANQRKAN
jgi:energy-converting hydrogenase Eha subunit E